MNADALKLATHETWRLYKWDAEMVGDNPPDPTQIDAAQHPACIEIIEIAHGQSPRTIHQRK